MCTQDLSGLDCDQCLHKALGLLADGSRSGRLLFPSCVIRYEMYSFNDSIVSLPAPPTPPPSAPVPDIVLQGKGRLPAAMIVVIVVLITFSIILFTICICFLRKKSKKKSNLKTEVTESVNIEVGTNKFSPDNKIGEVDLGKCSRYNCSKKLLLSGMSSNLLLTEMYIV
ncbi:hypothetical protein LIER_02913 [Lithospermum erythrorhizon]|uniref:Gnk2-homologous domain-containing protein n=1 Tax=Lithospermum erythrorhizon TaxID=34254 RepID=A0AAV3NSS7_LITER